MHLLPGMGAAGLAPAPEDVPAVAAAAPEAGGPLSQAERLRLAEEAGGIAHWEYDVSRNRSWLSGNFAALYGLPPEVADRLEMRSFLALVHPDDRGRVEQATYAAVRTGLIDEEYRIRLPASGEERWLHTIGRCHHRPEGPVLVGINQDVTERRQMAAALAQQEQRLRLVQDATGAGVWSWDAVADRQTWCAEQYRLHGLDPSRPAPSFAEWVSWVHPEDRPALIRASRDGFEGPGGAYRLVVRLRRPGDGATRWFLCFGRAQARGADGVVTRMEGVNIDLTGEVPPHDGWRPAAHALLRRLAEGDTHLRLVEEVAGAGTWCWPAFAERGVWSERQFRLHGLDPAGPVPTAAAWFGWIHPADRAAVLAATERGFAAPDGRYDVVCRIRPPGAADWIWLMCFGCVRRLADGTVDRVEGVTLDVSREYRLREDLARSEQMLRAVTETVPDLIFVKDRDGRLQLANPACLGAIGRPEADVLGRTDADWHHDAAEAAAIMANDQAIMASAVPRVVEEVFTTAGGGTRVWRASKTPMRDAAGRVVGLVGVGTDVTEFRATEAALRSAVGARETLVREADHRIKNSLQLVASLLQMQARRARGETATALEAAAARVIAIGHAHRTLYGSPDLRSVDLCALLHDLAAHTRDLADPAIAVRCESGPSLPVDAERGIPLGLVVSELMTNALRHAFPDGRAGTILLRAERRREPGGAETIAVTVRDDGVGFAAAGSGERAKAGSGERAKAGSGGHVAAGAAPGGGRGLGGSIVRALTAQIGARIDTCSDAGGTAVVLSLPLAPPPGSGLAPTRSH